jgi:hypothetical protein
MASVKAGGILPKLMRRSGETPPTFLAYLLLLTNDFLQSQQNKRI